MKYMTLGNCFRKYEKRKKKGILRKNALKNKTNIDIIAKTSLSNVKCVRKYFLNEVTNYIDIYSVRSGSYPTIRHKPKFQPRNTRFITLIMYKNISTMVPKIY